MNKQAERKHAGWAQSTEPAEVEGRYAGRRILRYARLAPSSTRKVNDGHIASTEVNLSISRLLFAWQMTKVKYRISTASL